MEKMARRYGLNAVALSGACSGKPLADCVCGKMKSANRYSEGLMMKLANRLVEKDPMEECVEDHIRNGMETSAACEECDKLKKQALSAYPEEDEVENVIEAMHDDMLGMGDGLIYEVDNFENDMFELDSGDQGLGAQVAELIDAINRLVDNMGAGSEGMDLIDGEESASDIVEDVEEFSDDYEGGPAEDMEESYEDDGEDSIEFDIEDDDDNSEDLDEDLDGDLDEDLDEDSDEGLDDEANKGCGYEMAEKESMEDKHGEGCECPQCCCDDDEKDHGDDEHEDKSRSDKGQKSEKENNDDNEKDAYAETMSSKRIKRYNESDTLSTLTAAETMQINDLLGDRKISDNPAEKDVKQEGSQEVVDKYSDGKTMGNEEKFDAKDPDVPARGNGSTMGDGESMPEGKAKVPAGEGAMGSEGEIVDTSVSVNADGIATSATEKAVKTAADKKVEDPKAVEDSKDLKGQTLSNGKGMGSEKEDGLTPDTLKDPDVPMDNQLMGPDESKDFENPKVPAGSGGMGHENETVGTEVSVETKGTVIAQVEAKAEAKVKEASVRAERVKLATKLAALELLDREITEAEYDDEITKLASSSVPTLRTLIHRYEDRRAKRLAQKSNIQKVEDTVESNGGLETPLLISKEASNNTLKDDIMGMFSLEKKIRSFEDTE
jgi:hypothetical protein